MQYPVVVLSRSDAYATGYPAADTLSGLYHSLVVRYDDESALRNAYRYINETRRTCFSITIAVSGAIGMNFISQLLPLLFIPGFLRVGNRRILAITGENPALLLTAKEVLQAAVRRQGFEDLEILLLTLQENDRWNKDTSLPLSQTIYSDSHVMQNAYLDAMTMGMTGTIFYTSATEAELPPLLQLLRQAETQWEAENPLAVQLLKTLQTVADTNGELKKQYASTLKELNNYKKHLELLRSSHQATELQNYYNREYEILPRWYKRFGHLLKAMAGKRSFRSLFQDNVKKYKD